MTFVDKSQDGKDAITKATVKWLFQACILVQGQAIALVRVDSGRLRKSLAYEVDEKEMVGYVGTNVDYAVYVEFGTGEMAENGKGRKGGWIYKDEAGKVFFTYGQPPKPYLRPAFTNTRGQIEALAKEIYGGI